jgi:hypothetical protein
MTGFHPIDETSETLRWIREPDVLNGAPHGADDPGMERPTLERPNLTDVVGGLVLLTISALLVAVAVVIAAG